MIILTALEKDPDHRYPSAMALADDLEHYLRHEPIVPHVSRFYRIRKFAQRRKAHSGFPSYQIGDDLQVLPHCGTSVSRATRCRYVDRTSK